MTPASSDETYSGPSGPGSDASTSPAPAPPPSSAPPDAAAARWARAADWDRHRAVITELYRDRGMRLDEVVHTMGREHGFHAK